MSIACIQNISTEILEQLSKLHPTNVLYLHGLRFVCCL